MVYMSYGSRHVLLHMFVIYMRVCANHRQVQIYIMNIPACIIQIWVYAIPSLLAANHGAHSHHRNLSSSTSTPAKPATTPAKPAMAATVGGTRNKMRSSSSLSRPGTQRLRVDVGASQQDEDKEAIDALKLLSSGYGEAGFNESL